jgi:glycerate dehydrogenase
MKAVFLDFATLGPGLNVDVMHEAMPDIEIYDETGDSDVAERIADAEIVVANKSRFSAELLQNCPSLRLITLAATGTDNVDLEAAREHGVAVCNIRAYCTQSIAEHVFGCLLNLTHNLGRYNATAREGAWQKSDDFCLMSFPIRELSEMTLGIVGFGSLGKGVAKIAQAFGMNVIISARPGTVSVADDRVPFEEVLQRSDVISLHCPLTDATAGLFGEKEFQAMKSDAFLINTARGGLIDSDALVAALKNGEIAAAALDVLPQEPPVDGNPLLDYDAPNLMITPHIAWGTDVARQAALDQTVGNVAAFLRGEEQNRVV